jgi:N6-L-threonylcarbamoyladenine synthase
VSVFIGIDTSNYTTSVAAYDSQNGNMISEKAILKVKNNACGLRQSDAVFEHVTGLSDVFKRVMIDIKEKPAAIGFSKTPCDFEGSYMPCFTVGKMLAESIDSAYGVKCYAFSHQRGHIAAALYSVGKPKLFDEPFIALHISGGTTDLLKVVPDDEMIIKPEMIGNSLDLKAGQAVDRVGVMLSLSFPCGAELEKLAECSQKSFKIKPYIRDMSCSLSGLENKAKAMFDKGESRQDISKFCLDYILSNLKGMCRAASEKYAGYPFVFAGGVMSNKYLKAELQKEFGGYFAEPRFSSDNAAGIAYLCKIAHERNICEHKF